MTDKTKAPSTRGRSAATGRFTSGSAASGAAALSAKEIRRLKKQGTSVIRRMPDDVVDLDVEVVRDSRGRRITEADAARIAEETLAQVGRRPGRPSLTAAGQRSPQIAFRVSADVRRLAEELAAAEGRTVSELARHALEQYVRAGRPNG